MRFSHKDKKNELVQLHSTFALAFPEKISEAPESCGVIILLNEADDVLFVDYTREQSTLKQQLAVYTDTAQAVDCVAYRWFRTFDCHKAQQLAEAWVAKYSPFNQT